MPFSNRSSLKKIPQINWNAASWNEMIDLADLEGATSPMLEEITDSEITVLINESKKPDIADLPSHSQSVERSVKLVSEACQNTYGIESRHKTIMAKLLSRKIRPSFMSKGHYCHSYEELESDL